LLISSRISALCNRVKVHLIGVATVVYSRNR
jgi:hypothetical protein